MLGSNHGNCQVSVSLPLPLTLRCHHVSVTSWAPHVPPTDLPPLVPGLPRCVWQRDTVAAGLCRGSPSAPAQGLDPGVQHHPGCAGAPGAPLIPWDASQCRGVEEGAPLHPAAASLALAASLPGSAGGRSPTRRTKQHLQTLNHAAGPALPKIARWGGLPCQH